MSKFEELTNCIKKFSHDDLQQLLGLVTYMLSNIPAEKPCCPYCGSANVIRYGLKRGKQRFLCKHCGRTFVTTTHTVMSHSHFGADIWTEVIRDTVCGDAINYTAKRLGLSHQTVFHMRHKLFLALQQLPERKSLLLGEVTELDETFVLDSYKGKRLPDTVCRKARKHGATAAKRGISNEYICICTGIQRNGSAYAATVNRAKPSADELAELFGERIAQGTLALCDGLKSYHILTEIVGCTIKDCSTSTKEEKCFYHLNTVNGFHSFIKQRYDFYRGVATKYLNRYNTLFSAAYRNIDCLIQKLAEMLLSVGTMDYFHSNKDVKEQGLLFI